jgi:hypothetical protein
MCDPEVHCFRTRPCFLNRLSFENREGVDPNGSLGGVHLSFYHPHPLAEMSRQPILYRRRSLSAGESLLTLNHDFPQSTPAAFQSSTPRSGIARNPHILVPFLAYPVSLLYERFSLETLYAIQACMDRPSMATSVIPRSVSVAASRSGPCGTHVLSCFRSPRAYNSVLHPCSSRHSEGY